MSRYLLVDGHSVIFNWQELCALHSRNSSQARDLLRRQLEDLHDSGEWRVTLVFDGKGEKVSEEKDPASMVVLYSQGDQTADSIIEKIVGQQKDRSNITVVTGDEAERQTIEALGAIVTSPDWLEGELRRCGGDVRRAMEQIHKQAKW